MLVVTERQPVRLALEDRVALAVVEVPLHEFAVNVLLLSGVEAHLRGGLAVGVKHVLGLACDASLVGVPGAQDDADVAGSFHLACWDEVVGEQVQRVVAVAKDIGERRLVD